MSHNRTLLLLKLSHYCASQHKIYKEATLWKEVSIVLTSERVVGGLSTELIFLHSSALAIIADGKTLANAQHLLTLRAVGHVPSSPAEQVTATTQTTTVSINNDCIVLISCSAITCSAWVLSTGPRLPIRRGWSHS